MFGYKEASKDCGSIQKAKVFASQEKEPSKAIFPKEMLLCQVPRNEPYGQPWLNINPITKHYNMRVERFDNKLDDTCFVSKGFASCPIHIEKNFNLNTLEVVTGSKQIDI